MTDRDTWNTYAWEGEYGDLEGDEVDKYARRRGAARPAFTFVRSCVRCDGFMVDARKYAHVDEETATVCHHCRGLVRCQSGRHHIKRGAGCVVCEVFHAPR